MTHAFRLFIILNIVSSFSLILGCRNVAPLHNSRIFHFCPQPVTVNGKVGYIDPFGKLCIPPTFYSGGEFIDGFATVELEEGSQPSIINMAGDELCKWPTLVENELFVSFYRGSFIITRFNFSGNKCRIVSVRRQKQDISMEYEMTHFSFENGLLAVKKNGKWGFINEKGNLVVKYEFAAVQPFSEGLAPVKKGDRWGYIRRDGTWAIQPIYFYAAPFREGMACVTQKTIKGRTINVIDPQGQPVIQDRTLLDKIQLIDGYSEGLTWFWYINGNSGKKRGGYMDRDGKIIISDRDFSYGAPFLYGLAPFCIGNAVEKEDCYGIVDRAGNVVVEPKYHYISACLGSPLYAVKEKRDSKIIYIDVHCRIVWPPDRRGESL